ncbi:ADP-ribosylglycohydrolase [Filimonas zeae]|nr:ADP-ribosylglycohydrolase family protein [Filimonas zeae]MDR6340214.1 ADP-ribosylglycohydrolase [Filimonas zeae]
MDKSEMTAITPINLAGISLTGLSVGDALGETFFGPEAEINARIQERRLQPGDWLYTDDTVMGIGIYNVLSAYGHIDQNALAKEFADNYLLDNYRGYGGTAHSILRGIAEGQHWKQVSSNVFDGMGSMGNGAAMRSGLIGAYFYNDTRQVIEQARLAAEVTHYHSEAVAGAISVALAACICARKGINRERLPPATLYDFVISHTPESEVKRLIKKAATLPADYDIRTIVAVLGNGLRLTAQDTVPFAIWCIANNSGSYSEAIWKGISGLGDRDTIGAIIGSVVVLSAGAATIPEQWLLQTEKFGSSIFSKQK